jgi:hypothetical protein
MISAAFCSKFGSVDRTYRSKRWGCRPARCQARATIVCCTPSFAPNRRGGPMRRAIRGRFARPAQDPRLQLWRQYPRLRSAMASTQPGHARGLIPRFPGCDRLRRTVDTFADRRVRISVRQQQDDPGPPRFIGTAAVGPRERVKLRALCSRQCHRCGSQHAAYYHSTND